MRRRPLVLAFAAVLAAALAQAANAQTPPAAPAAKPAPPPEAPLTQLFISPMGEPFRATDAEPYPSAAWFAGADTNHDGVISRTEFRADALRFFKVLDVTGDGRIADNEIARYEYQIAPEIVASTRDTSDLSLKKPDDDDDSKVRRPGLQRQGAAFYTFLNDAEPVRSADTDFNMKVTLDEWMAAADRRFKALDPDDTGGLKLADLPRPPTQKRGK